MAAAIPNPRISWDQTPEYLALTNRVIPTGGQTTYTRSHPAGTSPTDRTSFVYGQRDVHLGNWPEIMYMLFPTPEWETFKKSGKPSQKLDANQRPLQERISRQGMRPRILLDFPVLPDTISHNEELWRFDLWRRIDPRTSWNDLIMRIEVPGRTRDSDKQLSNSMQTMIGRWWHQRYHMISWFGKGRYHYNNVNDSARIKLLAKLSNATPPIPLALNTTKGLTPGSVNLGLGPNGPVVPWPSVAGGTIRGPRTPTTPVGAVPSNVAAPIILPLAIAPAATIAIDNERDAAAAVFVEEKEEDDDETSESDWVNSRMRGEDDGTDAFEDSMSTAPDMSISESFHQKEDYVELEMEWVTTDESDEDELSAPPAKRRRIEVEIRSDATHESLAADIDGNTTAPFPSQSQQPMMAQPASPLSQITGAADYSDYYAVSGDLPPDGYTY